MESTRGWARAGLAVVLGATIVVSACSTAWIGQAEQIVAALIPAAENIVALVAALQGKGVSAADVQTIQNAGAQAGADLQTVQALITAYQKADAAAQPGILGQMQAAIEAARSNLEGLLPAMHIQDAATKAKVTAVVGIVLSEVQSLEAVVPIVKNTPTLTAQNAVRMGHPSGPVKAPLSASSFVASYNATLTAKTGNAGLDRVTAGLKIHEHGKVERVLTAGMLK